MNLKQHLLSSKQRADFLKENINRPVEDLEASRFVDISLTARSVICTGRPDRVLISCDYRNQEVLTAGVLSGDPAILRCFDPNEPEELITVVDGKEVKYANPNKDMHLLTARYCVHPKLFDDQPEWNWLNIAKDTSLISRKGCARDEGKKCNFGIQYGQSAETLAKQNYVPLEETKQWLKRHKLTYPQFHLWSERVASLTEACGFSVHADGRIRWCNESNSKGNENSTGRIGVNAQIQGLCASQTKLAIINLSKTFEGTEACVLLAIHDK